MRRRKSGGVSTPLKDLTPAEFACTYSASCPAVLVEEGSNSYVIIGKTRDAESPGLAGRVGPGETAIEISADLLQAALRKTVD